MTSSLRVLTLNTFGLPDMITRRVYAKYPRNRPSRTARMAAIADRLHSYDIVCLQEVWMNVDQVFFQDWGAANGLSYSHYTRAGPLVGTGILILSRLPIVATAFHRFSLNGHPQRVLHGDWYAAKGVAMFELDGSEMGVGRVLVYSSHLHAQYERADEYEAHRVAQAYEMIQFVSATAIGANLVLVMGDMNAPPASLVYDVLVNGGRLQLTDAWAAANGDESPGGMTIPDDIGFPRRIDYVFFADPADALELASCRVVMNEWFADLPGSAKDMLSDHFGVAARLVIKARRTRELAPPRTPSPPRHSIAAASPRLFSPVRQPATPSKSPGPLARTRLMERMAATYQPDLVQPAGVSSTVQLRLVKHMTQVLRHGLRDAELRRDRNKRLVVLYLLVAVVVLFSLLVAALADVGTRLFLLALWTTCAVAVIYHAAQGYLICTAETHAFKELITRLRAVYWIRGDWPDEPY